MASPRRFKISQEAQLSPDTQQVLITHAHTDAETTHCIYFIAQFLGLDPDTKKTFWIKYHFYYHPLLLLVLVLKSHSEDKMNIFCSCCCAMQPQSRILFSLPRFNHFLLLVRERYSKVYSNVSCSSFCVLNQSEPVILPEKEIQYQQRYLGFVYIINHKITKAY